jgi:hypothetical protein
MRRIALRLPLILLLLVIAAAGLAAQSDSSARSYAVISSPQSPCDSVHPSGRVDALRLALIGGVTAGGFVYGHVLQTTMWWKGERSAFHFEWAHDWRYALGADKLGHAWFPYAVAHTYDELLRWASVDSSTAIWSAASLALAYQTYIEVRDGFSAKWGFSPGDFAADAIGAALPVAQHYAPALRLFDFKMSFFPSDSFRAGSNRAIIDDYESSYHWLTVHVADVLPESWRGDYPAFIDLAIGHGVKQLDDNGGGTHEIFLALDWNLDRLPGNWWGWNLVRHIVRHYHLPSPALKLYPGPLEIGFRF